MALVSIAFIYNAIVIPLRATFDEVYSHDLLYSWLAWDFFFADFVYFLDVAVVQTHVYNREKLDLKKAFKETKVCKVLMTCLGEVNAEEKERGEKGGDG